MKYPNCFQMISSEFRKAGVTFLLVGGLAVNQHKYARATLDADFLITEDAYQKVLAILEAGGYRLVDKQNLVARFVHEEPFFMDVDIMFTDEGTLKEMLEEAGKVTLRGGQFLVPSLDHLMAMKLHALKQGARDREFKDLGDILELVRANRIQVDTDRFKNLCLKYATEEIYERISRAAKDA